MLEIFLCLEGEKLDIHIWAFSYIKGLSPEILIFEEKGTMSRVFSLRDGILPTKMFVQGSRSVWRWGAGWLRACSQASSDRTPPQVFTSQDGPFGQEQSSSGGRQDVADQTIQCEVSWCNRGRTNPSFPPSFHFNSPETFQCMYNTLFA